MFYWPHLELTDYEKQFVRVYANRNKPGVLRRTYRGILNTTADDTIPELRVPKLSARVQISRRSRVFMLSFAGDCAKWRLHVSKANGERYTATNPGAPTPPTDYPPFVASDAPVVAAMCPGAFWSAQSSLGVPPSVFGEGVNAIGMTPNFRLPVAIEPNWQLSQNDTLIFEGYPIVDEAIVLEIAVHAWEFPAWGC